MSEYGTLYIVATPIGNLQDISLRATHILGQVALVAAEDTRHTQKLLNHLGLTPTVIAYHAFNEASGLENLLTNLRSGRDVALVSDAGTPLISDPGYPLVRAARAEGIPVSPIPGPSAVITGLCASGLPSDAFYFSGFLPAKSSARQKVLKQLAHQTATLVFYESPHRILNALSDIQTVLGEREVVIGRELTKQFETFLSGTVSDVIKAVSNDANQQKGEFVVMVAGAPETETMDEAQAQAVLDLLVKELPVKKAAQIAHQITGFNKNRLYDMAISKDRGAS